MTKRKIAGLQIPCLSPAELVLDMLSADEPKRAVATLCRAGEIIGIRPSSTRVAVTRLLNQGKLISESRGLYALGLPPHSLVGDVRQWRQREQRVKKWNQGWLILLDHQLPSSERTRSKIHNRALQMRGFAKLHKGVQLRPDNLKTSLCELREELDALGLAPQSQLLAVRELEPADRRQALQLWDSQTLAQQTCELIEALETSLAQQQSQAQEEAAADALLLGRHCIRFILHDPQLPDEMADSDLRRQLIKTMVQYQKVSSRLWDRVLKSSPDL